MGWVLQLPGLARAACLQSNCRVSGWASDLSVRVRLCLGSKGVGLYSRLHLGFSVRVCLSLKVAGVHCHLLSLLGLCGPCTCTTANTLNQDSGSHKETWTSSNHAQSETGNACSCS